ncbi:MAG: D-alanyl-D-alanine carboxypeptidase [Oscillospiraceae bacterium]
MKKFLAVFTVIMLMLNLIPCVEADAVSFTPPFEVNSESAVLYNLDTDTILYAKNSQKQQAPAQLAQIMTAVVCLENCNDLETVVACPASVFDDFASYRETYPDIFIPVANLDIDEEVTMKTLLYAMMLASSTEAAGTIAYHIGNGSTKVFVGMMNDKAKELGCENTVFTNPHGLYDPAQLTTAEDMVKIIKYALTLDEFEKISTATSYEMPASNKHTEPWEITHTNLMTIPDSDYYYQSAHGIKTGYGDETGRALATKASQDGTNHILVLLNAPIDDQNGNTWFSHIEDAKNIFDWAFKNLSYKSIITTEEESQEAKVMYSADDAFVILKPYQGYKVLWDNTVSVSLIEKRTEVFDNVTAPVTEGDVLGKLSLVYNGETIFQTDLIASKNVELSKSKYWASVAGGFFKSKWFMLSLLFGFMLSVIYIAYYIYQYNNMMAARKKALAAKNRNAQQKKRPPSNMNSSGRPRSSGSAPRRPQGSGTSAHRKPHSSGTSAQRRPQGSRPNPQRKPSSSGKKSDNK